MAASHSGSSRFFSAIALTLVISVGLGEFYTFINARLHLAPWIGVLIAHGALSAFLYLTTKSIRTSLTLRGGPLMPWLAAPLVLLGAWLLAMGTPRDGISYAPTGSSEVMYALATLTVIPLVEEIVFRGAISPFVSRFTGPWSGVWFGALVFSMAHSNPTWNRLIAFKVGLPIGPFLLAICCDMIVRRWGRIWPAVAFHGACNATVYIFANLNPSWIRHFGGLYM